MICGLGLDTPMNWRSPEKLFWKPFLGITFAAVSLVLGLEHSCPWPQEGRFLERLSLALASDFFVSLALASSLVSSTPPLTITSCAFRKMLFVPTFGKMRKLTNKKQAKVQNIADYLLSLCHTLLHANYRRWDTTISSNYVVQKLYWYWHRW